jgi:threonine dehydrogenase-like Zn-dependent dehydrogenase
MIGHIVEIGSEIQNFKVGDLVVSAFSTSCGGFHSPERLRLADQQSGSCLYCNKQYSSRCLSSQNVGTSVLDGAQAEYFRLPLADTTLFHAPSDIPPDLLVMMADILPTGYQVAYNAKTLLSSDQPARTEKDDILDKSGVCVVIGCGPVSERFIVKYTTADASRLVCVLSQPPVLCSKPYTPQISLRTGWKQQRVTVPSLYLSRSLRQKSLELRTV